MIIIYIIMILILIIKIKNFYYYTAHTEKNNVLRHNIVKNYIEIYSVASDATEFISSVSYFQRRLPKTRRYTLKCVTRLPAEGQGPTPFPKSQD